MLVYLFENSSPRVAVVEDIVRYKLLHRTVISINEDAARYLLELYPDVIATNPIKVFYKNNIRLHSCHSRLYGLSLLSLLIGAGLHHNIGCEFAIGGLFEGQIHSDNWITIRRIEDFRLCAALEQVLEEGECQSIIHDIIAYIEEVLRIHRAPILHAYILLAFAENLNRHVVWDGDEDEDFFISKWCTTIRDRAGQLPLHLAVKAKIGLKGIESLVKANPLTVEMVDFKSGLYPFQLALTDEPSWSVRELEVALKLLRACSRPNPSKRL